MTIKELIDILDKKLKSGVIDNNMEILMKERDGEGYCYDLSAISIEYVCEGIGIDQDGYDELPLNERNNWSLCVVINTD